MSNPLGIQADPDLLAKGWERRQLVGADRIEEMVELYTSLNFDVLAEKPTAEDMGEGCQHCASVICSSYLLLYTRPK